MQYSKTASCLEEDELLCCVSFFSLFSLIGVMQNWRRNYRHIPLKVNYSSNETKAVCVEAQISKEQVVLMKFLVILQGYLCSCSFPLPAQQSLVLRFQNNSSLLAMQLQGKPTLVRMTLVLKGLDNHCYLCYRQHNLMIDTIIPWMQHFIILHIQFFSNLYYHWYVLIFFRRISNVLSIFSPLAP